METELDRREQFIMAVHAAINAAGIPKKVIVMLDTEVGKGYEPDELVVKLDYIEVPRRLRNQGWGSKVMQCIVELADQMDIVIELRAANDDAGAFFGGFGFEGWGWMLRRPSHTGVASARKRY